MEGNKNTTSSSIPEKMGADANAWLKNKIWKREDKDAEKIVKIISAAYQISPLIYKSEKKKRKKEMLKICQHW